MARSWILPAIAGILFALSMPGAGLALLIFLAFITLFFSLKDLNPRESAKIGFKAGFIGGLLLFWWVYSLWEWIYPLAIFVHIVLAIYTGLFWGIFGYLYGWLKERAPQIVVILAVPMIWTLLEYVRSLTIFGFPWAQAADGLSTALLMSNFIQIASFAGIWGVSFLILMGSYLVFLAWDTKRPVFYTSAIILFIVWSVAGSFDRPSGLSKSELYNLALVQPSVAQKERSDPLNLPRFMSIYEDLLDQVEQRDEDVDLVVLPESALPAFVLSHPDTRDFFTNWSDRLGSPIMLGTFTNLNNDVFNSVAYVTEHGPTNNIYNKIQLVPFSTEFFPAIDLVKSTGIGTVFPLIDRLGRITPGDSFDPILTDLGLIGTPICFETLFPHISREFVRNGAEVIVSVTNDAWFHKTWALPQHFAKGVYRAIENRRYFVQTANSGISGVIGPNGRIEKRSLIEDRSVTFASIRLLNDQTFYTRNGDLLIYSSLAFLILTFSLLLLRGRRSQSPELSAE